MNTFEETGLGENILKALSEINFEKPTPIQAKAIPHLLNSKDDLLAFAQTGTGKTAAFGLPLIEQTDLSSKKVQSLILCPTRELCLQITNDLEKYSKYLKIHIVAVYGGTPIDKQIKALKKGGQIVVGTPGRMLDLIKRKTLKLSHVEYLVLDEADEMLTMGFKDDLDTILAETPSEKQTLLFSATMPKEVANIAKKYLHSPFEISTGKRNIGAENVTHEFYVVNSRDRYLALKRIVDINLQIYGIVFCRTRRETKEVADKLMQDGYNADALHGDLSQAQRDQVMERFRQKHLQILVATDVAARGLDVNNLSHIINFNLPDDIEIYTHRSGRTGRAGKSGHSLAIVTNRELNRIRAIEKIIGKKFERKTIPSGKEICEKQLFKLIDKVEKIEVDERLISEYLPIINKKLDWLSREELIKHFVSAEFNRFLEYYKNAPDLNAKFSERLDKNNTKSNKSRSNLSRFFINIGTKNNLNPARLIGFINENISVKNIEIGKIEILKSFSFFEVDNNYQKEVLNGLNNSEFEGINIYTELSKEKKKKNSSPKFQSDSFSDDKNFKRKRNRKKKY